MQVIVNNIRGFLPARIVAFLMNVHTHQRDIYLSRHGQSEPSSLPFLGLARGG